MLTDAEVSQILASVTCAGIDADNTPAGKMRRDWLEARAEIERLRTPKPILVQEGAPLTAEQIAKLTPGTLVISVEPHVTVQGHRAALESLRERCARIAARFGDYEWRHVWGAETDVRKAPELISAAILRAPLELNEDGLPVPLEDPKP